MTTPKSTELQTTYQPNTSQKERAAALNRFNWLYVYTPIILATFFALAVVGLLFVGAFSPGLIGAREFASALADIILILTIMPMLLLCAIVPLGAIGFYVYQRQQPKREYGRLQLLFWRLDSLLNTIQYKTKEIVPKIASPLISLNVQLAYLEAWLKQLKKIITRS